MKKQQKPYVIFLGINLLLLLVSTKTYALPATNLSGVLSNSKTEIGSFETLLSYIAYLLGGTVLYTAFKKLYAYSNGREEIPLSDPIWRGLGGAFLIGMPTMVVAVLNTFGITSDGSTVRGAAVTTGNGAGLDTLMANLISDIYTPAKLLMKIICFMGGGLSAIIGFKKLADAGKGGNQPGTANSSMSYLIAGATLIAMGQSMDLVTTSIFGAANTGKFTVLSYSPPGISTAQANNVFAALFNFVELIGWIAFIRGIMILRSISEGRSNRTPTQAFIFLIAGATAVNMYGFIKALQGTLGITLVG